MTGKGTVIFIVDGRALRISPVYHIPDLNTHLLSLGQFLQSRLHSRGSDRKISLQQGKEEFLTFHPQKQGDTLYLIKTVLGADTSAQIATIHSIDFEIMHCRLAHLSKDVIIKAKKLSGVQPMTYWH